MKVPVVEQRSLWVYVWNVKNIVKHMTYKTIRLIAMIILSIASAGLVPLLILGMENNWEGFKSFYWSNE